jgi:hypothetical protein
MYKTKCFDCGYIWSHEDDYCPECGSENTDDFHLIECMCKECHTFKQRPYNPASTPDGANAASSPIKRDSKQVYIPMQANH